MKTKREQAKAIIDAHFCVMKPPKGDPKSTDEYERSLNLLRDSILNLIPEIPEGKIITKEVVSFSAEYGDCVSHRILLTMVVED